MRQSSRHRDCHSRWAPVRSGREAVRDASNWGTFRGENAGQPVRASARISQRVPPRWRRVRFRARLLFRRTRSVTAPVLRIVVSKASARTYHHATMVAAHCPGPRNCQAQQQQQSAATWQISDRNGRADAGALVAWRWTTPTRPETTPSCVTPARRGPAGEHCKPARECSSSCSTTRSSCPGLRD